MSAALKIEKGVPVPSKGRGLGRGPNLRVTLSLMKVGDSIFFEQAKIASVSSQVCQYQEKLSMKFTCRTVEGGVRVWRVS